MTPSPIRLQRIDGVPVLRLARPERRNAIDRGTVRAVGEAISELKAAGAPVAVLAAEPPTFCAGSDYAEIAGDLASNPVIGLTDALLASPVFWVAAVEGAAIGGGVAMLTACPIVVAAESATFSLPERHLGLFPSGVLPYLEAVVGARAAFSASILAEPFSAAMAADLGLVTETVPKGAVLPRALELAAALASTPAVTADGRRAWQAHFATDHFRQRRQALFDLLPASLPGAGASPHPRKEPA
jgi:enoyl-CoA hydratase/carnithine racemase